jgi:hypothetical protein
MMAVDEAGRLRLYRRLEEVLGVDEAEVLMAQLPLRGWDDIATKEDIVGLRGDIGNDIGGLRGEIGNQIGGLRGEIGTLRGQMANEIGGLRGELGTLRGDIGNDIAQLRGDIGGMRGEIGGVEHRLATQARMQFVALLGFLVAFAAVLVTALRVH